MQDVPAMAPICCTLHCFWVTQTLKRHLCITANVISVFTSTKTITNVINVWRFKRNSIFTYMVEYFHYILGIYSSLQYKTIEIIMTSILLLKRIVRSPFRSLCTTIVAMAFIKWSLNSLKTIIYCIPYIYNVTPRTIILRKDWIFFVYKFKKK